MAEFDQEQRGTSAGLLGGIFNPVEGLKTQFLTTYGLPTYYAMAQGTLNVAPFYFASLIPGISKLGINPWDKGPVWRQVMGAAFGMDISGAGSVLEGFGTALGKSGDALTTFKGAWLKDLKQFVVRNRYRKLSDTRIFLQLQKYLPNGKVNRRLFMSTGMFQKAASGIRLAQSVSTIGTAVTGPLTGIAIGNIAANLAGLAFKGAISALQFAQTEKEHMRQVEMGGSLGIGFMSGAAATERQRCIQELQRTPLAGRRFMGREASMYAGIT